MRRDRPWVSGIVLAAGTSSRLAGELPKQLLELDGRPLLRRVATAALDSNLAEVVVVLGHAARRVATAIAGLEVKIAENPDFRHGQSTSVRAGLAEIAPDASAAMFLPADQPLLSSRLIDRMIEVYEDRSRRDGDWIVVPTCAGQRGAPVLFGRAFFDELAGLEGDAGGRRLLPRHRSRIVEVEVGDAMGLADVDTEADLKQLEQLLNDRE